MTEFWVGDTVWEFSEPLRPDPEPPTEPLDDVSWLTRAELDEVIGLLEGQRALGDREPARVVRLLRRARRRRAAGWDHWRPVHGFGCSERGGSDNCQFDCETSAERKAQLEVCVYETYWLVHMYGTVPPLCRCLEAVLDGPARFESEAEARELARAECARRAWDEVRREPAAPPEIVAPSLASGLSEPPSTRSVPGSPSAPVRRVIGDQARLADEAVVPLLGWDTTHARERRRG